jgi:hypothetical protein
MLASKPQTHKSGLRYFIFIVFLSAVAPQTGARQTLMIMSLPSSSAVPSFVKDQDDHTSKCPVDSPQRPGWPLESILRTGCSATEIYTFLPSALAQNA